MTTNLDPDNIQSRLYKQLGALLADMETGGDANLREKIESALDDKRASPATLAPRIRAALDSDSAVTTRERIAALTAIGRVLTIFQALRGDQNEPERGSAVRRYATAFQRPASNATTRGKTSRRSASIAAALADTADDSEDGAA